MKYLLRQPSDRVGEVFRTVACTTPGAVLPWFFTEISTLARVLGWRSTTLGELKLFFGVR